MIDGSQENQRTPKTVWASTGIPEKLCESNHSRDDRAFERLRSERVDKEAQTEDADAWIERSLKLVGNRLGGNAKNQRRVRYFGFETTN